MQNTVRKMLFVTIVGFSAGIANIILYKHLGQNNAPWLACSLFLPVVLHLGSILSVPCKLSVKVSTAFFLIMVSHLGISFAAFLPGAPLYLLDIADLYAPFGTTLSALISMYFHQKAQREPPEEVIRCSNCRVIFHKYDAFCPQCQTISPFVQKTIDHFPNKRPLDFTPDIQKYVFCCPHCGILYREDKAGRSTEITAIALGTPLRACRSCHWFSIDPQYGEWVYMSKADRLRHLFHIDLYVSSCFFAVATVTTEYKNTLLTVIIFSIAVILTAIWTHIRLQDDIKNSLQRARRNPTYPYILKRMGYENFISKSIDL
ncbi:MAG: hypothetical protein IJA67_07815 [Oscillospiraceae bacterium]|nr:hypothetical protein [Oscillospiraceae bacterium]